MSIGSVLARKTFILSEPLRFIMLKKLWQLAVLTAFAGASMVNAAESSFPDKPIYLIVPYPAGGSTDVLARTLGEKVSKSLGQPVIVENRAGASGNIGA